MKHAKRAASLLLALVMVLALATTAFAAGAEPGAITVDNPTAGKTYTAYKIFDVTYNEDKTAYAYTIDSDATGSWFNDILLYMGSTWQEKTDTTEASYTGSAVAAVDGVYTGHEITLTPSATDNTVYILEVTDDFSAPDFARFLNLHKDDKTGTELTGTADTISADNLPLGYYFISNTNGALCNLTTTNPTVTIHDKNDNPFEKVDDKESVEIGETVTYTITGKVPDTTGFNDYTYEINDVMSDGLTFNKDVEVVIPDAGTDGADVTLVENTNYTVTYDVQGDGEDAPNPNRFKVSIHVIDLQQYVTKEIQVTYTATVNDNAAGSIEKNHATLTYSNDPAVTDSKATTPVQEETVYSAKIVIDKYAINTADETNTDTKLKDATFILYRYALDNGDGTYSFFKEGGDTAGNAYTAADIGVVKLYYKYTAATGDAPAKVEWDADKTKATPKTTDVNGAANFPGLEDGKYYLEETVAPAGYNLLKEAVEVTVDGTAATPENLAPLTVTESVGNNTGSILPETGGMGTTVFYILGSILLLGAVVLLVTKKRMGAEK